MKYKNGELHLGCDISASSQPDFPIDAPIHLASNPYHTRDITQCAARYAAKKCAPKRHFFFPFKYRAKSYARRPFN